MKQKRASLFLGLLLVAVGVWLIASRQVPSLRTWMEDNFSWPLLVIGFGVLLFILGLITSSPSMAVSACLFAGVGGILYYQVQENDFSSWKYMWALIPGFVGVGIILEGLFGEDRRENIWRGINLIIISAILFIIFATYFGGLTILGEYGLPVILISLGLYLLARGFLRGRKRETHEAG
jgi:hypothetical protein